MDQLIGPSRPTYNDLRSLSLNFDSNQSDISWRKVWDLDQRSDVQNASLVYSGGVNGRSIAVHQPELKKNCVNNSVSIYDYKYNLIFTYMINVQCDQLFIYVNKSDFLYVLTNKGVLFTFFGGYEKSRQSLIENIDFYDDSIIAADFWESGMVFLTRDAVFYVQNYKVTKLLAQLPEKYFGVSEFKAIPPEFTDNELPIVFMSDYSEDLIVIQENSFLKVPFEDQILGFAFSHNFKYAAFLCKNYLKITSSSLSESYLHLERENMEEFVQITWLGNLTPVVAFNDELAFIETTVDDNNNVTFQDFIFVNQLTYRFDNRVHLFSSFDGVFVLSDESIFLLSHISPEIQCAAGNYPIYSISRLIDAFDKQSYSKLMKLKQENILEEAVVACMKAAAEVFDSVQQQRLFLLSAAYGRAYCYSSDDNDSIDEARNDFYENNQYYYEVSNFSHLIQSLRICNTFQSELKILITPAEYDDTSSNDILMRCCNRQAFTLATEIADYLNVDKTPIFTEWCCGVANVIENNDIAFHVITQKKNENFDSNAIAIALRDIGRQELAKMIADDEKNPASIVPFYVQCGLWKEAFASAVKSSDMSLFITILHKAIELNCSEELLSSVISEDEISALTIYKLAKCCDFSEINNDINFDINNRILKLLYTIPVNNNTVEIIIRNKLNDKQTMYGPNEKFKLFKSKVKGIIGKYQHQWIPSIYNGLKHTNHVIRMEEALIQEKGNKGYMFQSFNSVFNKLILANDISTAMKIVRETQCNEKRYTVKIGQILAQNNRMNDFMRLADSNYKDYWIQFILISYFKWGKAQALLFIQNIKNQKKATELLAIVNQDDFPSDAILSKSSVKMFSSKIF